MSSVDPRKGSPSPGLPTRWNYWNLLLLVPLAVLVTPLYNAEEPRLFGFPYFYWLQFLFVPLGVLCVWVVYRMTGNTDGGTRR